MRWIDLHQDLLLHVERRDLFEGAHQTSFEQIESADATVVVATAFPVPEDGDHFSPRNNELITQDLRRYHERVQTRPMWKIITDGADMRERIGGDGHGLILHIEGLNAFEGRDDEWEMLEEWRSLGLCSLGLVWNKTNALGGGTEDPETGLSELGRDVVSWVEQNGLILDCAHMNVRTFWDVARISRRPLLVSHANARRVADDTRNLTDEQLKVVAESGGVVGVFCAPRFITPEPSATVDDLMLHVRHIVDLVGCDHVALGTDFGGLVSGRMDDLDQVDKVGLLWEALRKEGWSTDQIEKLAYRNAARVLGEHMQPQV